MLVNLIKDPPPLLVFEISEDGVTGMRRNKKTGEVDGRAERALEPGVVDASMIRPNVRDTARLAEAIGGIVEELGPLKRTDAAVLLPDASTRLMVIDFDSIPSKAAQRLEAIRSKLASSLPFDIESARIAYQLEKTAAGLTALVTVTPTEVVRQYEEAFDRAGLWPGYVEQSMAAALNLLESGRMTVLVKLSGGLMTIAAVGDGEVRMVRSVELAKERGDSQRLLDDMLTDLYPTRIYVEENLGARVERLTLAGFGELLAPALERFPAELEVEVAPLRAAGGVVGPREAGIWGYLSVQ